MKTQCKQSFRALFLAIFAFCSLASTAFAADFTFCADQLNSLGMFYGSDAGYELDRAPTRAEAATMLVRMLGKEEEALNTPYTAPFTDVLEWAQPYVGWLYEQGLTTGTTATTYSPSSICTSQMYASFCLRALGYFESNGDFAYDDAINYAVELGVIDGVNCNTTDFLRDDLVAVSYTTLSRPTKAGDSSLLQQLVVQGAISDSIAEPVLSTFYAYHAYEYAFESKNAYTSKETLTISDLSLYQNSMLVDTAHMETLSCSVRNVYTPEKSQLSVKTQIDDKLVSQFYYRDGVGYRNVYNNTSQESMTFASALNELDEPSAVPICQITDITQRTIDSEVHFVLTLDTQASTTQLQQTAEDMGYTATMQTTPTIKSLQYEVVMDANGLFSQQTLTTSFTMSINSTATVAYLTMNTYLYDYGMDVTVTYPTTLALW